MVDVDVGVAVRFVGASTVAGGGATTLCVVTEIVLELGELDAPQ